MSGVAGPAILSFASGPILGRALGVADRGQLALMTTVSGLALFVMELGLSNSVLVTAARSNGRVVSTERRVGLVFALMLLWGLSAAVGALFGSGDTTYVIIAICAIPVLLANVPRGVCLAMSKMAPLIAERWTQAVGRLALIVLLLWLGHLTATTAFIATTVGLVIASLWLLPKWRQTPTQADVADIRVIRFGMAMWSAGFASAVLLRLDQLVLANVASRTQLGLYAVAVGLSESMLMLTAALKMNYQGIVARTRSARPIFKPMAAVTLIGAVAALTLVPLGSPILRLLFGASFVPAHWMLVVLTLATAPGMAMDLAGSALTSLGQTRGQLISTVIAAVVTVVLLFPAAKLWGGVGCALVSLIGYSIGAAVAVGFLLKASSPKGAQPTEVDLDAVASMPGELVPSAVPALLLPAGATELQAVQLTPVWVHRNAQRRREQRRP